MRADSPASVMDALGKVEDQIDEMLGSYAAAAGFLAQFERMERTLYLATKQQLADEGLLADAKTETEKKDRVERFMREVNPELFDQAQRAAQVEAHGKAMFKGLDARRSIGQSLLKIHAEAEQGKRFGQGARGQVGS